MRPPFPLRTMRTRVPSESRSWSSAARVCTSLAWLRRFARGRRGRLLDERFGFAHRQAARDDVARDAELRRFVGEREQRARMAHRERARRDVRAHFLRQAQQAHVVGDRRAILPDRGGDLLLRQLEFVGEPPVGRRFFDRIEILALDVLDQRDGEQRSSGMSRTTTGTLSRPARCAARQRRSPATISKPLVDLADDDRLDDAVGADRARSSPTRPAPAAPPAADRRSRSTSIACARTIPAAHAHGRRRASRSSRSRSEPTASSSRSSSARSATASRSSPASAAGAPRSSPACSASRSSSATSPGQEQRCSRWR